MFLKWEKEAEVHDGQKYLDRAFSAATSDFVATILINRLPGETPLFKLTLSIVSKADPATVLKRIVAPECDEARVERTIETMKALAAERCFVLAGNELIAAANLYDGAILPGEQALLAARFNQWVENERKKGYTLSHV